MLDVEFYRLYGDLRVQNLMPCLCRDFCEFLKSLPCFSTFFMQLPMRRMRICFTDVFFFVFCLFRSPQKYQTAILGNS